MFPHVDWIFCWYKERCPKITGRDLPGRPPPIRRAFWGSQLNQGLTPQLLLHAVGRLAVNVFEGPARCRATCWILVNIMPVNSWPGVANWRGSAEPCGVVSSTEDQPKIFPCAASRFFYDARV